MENSVDPTTLLRKYKFSLLTDNCLTENEQKVCNYLNNELSGLNSLLDLEGRIIKLFTDKAIYNIYYIDNTACLRPPEMKMLMFYQFVKIFGLKHSEAEFLFSEWLSYLYLDCVCIKEVVYTDDNQLPF